MAYTFNNVVANASLVSAASVATIASPSVSYYPTGNYQGMAIGGYVNMTNNTSTSFVLVVKTGSATTGTTIQAPMTVTTVAGNNFQVPFYVVDTSNPPSAQYNVTVQCASGTGTATTNSASIYTDIVNL